MILQERDRQKILVFIGFGCIFIASHTPFPLSLLSVIPFVGLSGVVSGLTGKEIGIELLLSALLFLIIPMGVLCLVAD